MEAQPAVRAGAREWHRSQHSDPALERVTVGLVQKLPRVRELHPRSAILRARPRSPPSPGQQSLQPQ